VSYLPTYPTYKKAGLPKACWLAAADGAPIYLRYLKIGISVSIWFGTTRHSRAEQQPWSLHFQHLCCYSDSDLHDRRCSGRRQGISHQQLRYQCAQRRQRPRSVRQRRRRAQARIGGLKRMGTTGTARSCARVQSSNVLASHCPPTAIIRAPLLQQLPHNSPCAWMECPIKHSGYEREWRN